MVTNLSKGDLWNYQPVNYLFTPSQRAAVMSHGIFPVGDETDVFTKYLCSTVLLSSSLLLLRFSQRLRSTTAPFY